MQPSKRGDCERARDDKNEEEREKEKIGQDGTKGSMGKTRNKETKGRDVNLLRLCLPERRHPAARPSLLTRQRRTNANLLPHDLHLHTGGGGIIGNTITTAAAITTIATAAQ
ncbi:hypothetical protein KEM54_000542, partial [Ascosphaera aggregata]